MKAVVFPIYNWIGKPNKWENFGKKETTTMTQEELHLWLKAGMDIQPHTLNHPFLTECKDEELEKEILNSKQGFEKLLDRPMNYLCYPYGFFDKRVIEVVKKADYKMAFAIFDNVSLWHINLFALPRIPIPSHQKMWEFKLKVSSINVIFVAMRKWERDFKRFNGNAILNDLEEKFINKKKRLEEYVSSSFILEHFKIIYANIVFSKFCFKTNKYQRNISKKLTEFFEILVIWC